MAGIKFTIHPLFFIFGIYFAFTGKVFSFLVFTFSAVIHELGHSFVSGRLGYKLNRIVLMPYGALISGDLSDLKYKDECLIALGGPITNFAVATAFLGLWWLVPETYVYTDIIVLANISLALINLLPAFPLDGGRFLRATLSLFFRTKTADIIVRILGLILGLCLLAFFIYTCFNVINFTILFFSAFIIIGALDKSKQNRYIKIFENINAIYVKRPTEIKIIAVNQNQTVKDLLRFTDGNRLYEFYVYDTDGNLIKKLNGKNLYGILSTESPYTVLKDIINN